MLYPVLRDMWSRGKCRSRILCCGCEWKECNSRNCCFICWKNGEAVSTVSKKIFKNLNGRVNALSGDTVRSASGGDETVVLTSMGLVTNTFALGMRTQRNRMPETHYDFHVRQLLNDRFRSCWGYIDQAPTRWYKIQIQYMKSWPYGPQFCLLM